MFGINLPDKLQINFQEPEYPMSVDDQIKLETHQLTNNLEYEVDNFVFNPDNDILFHILGDESILEVVVKNNEGVAMCGIPVQWSLYESNPDGDLLGGCYDNNGVELPYTSPLIDCFENGFPPPPGSPPPIFDFWG